MTVIMVKNRTEWADVLPFGLETVRYDGSLLTLMKIDVYKLQRAVGPRTRILNLCVCAGGGVKMQDIEQAWRCLCVIDGVHACRCLWEM